MKNQADQYNLKISFGKTYSVQAIKRAVYHNLDKAFVFIEEKEDQTLVYLRFKQTIDFDEFCLTFNNLVLDHQIRIDTEKEFKPIQQMIVAQAFEPCENLQEIIPYLAINE